MALAAGGSNYTPPRNIANIKRKLGMLPVVYAETESMVIVDSDVSDSSIFVELAKNKQIQIVDAKFVRNHVGDLFPTPWGWNPVARKYFSNLGFDSSVLPSDKELSNLRSAAHRKNTIDFHKCLNEILGDYGIEVPRECKTINDVNEAVASVDYSVLKAPLSSSGKGVQMLSEITPDIEHWIEAVIHKQGSVMWERKEDVSFDFASEWELQSGNVHFVGLSLFATDSGKYVGNISASQSYLEKKIGSDVGIYIDAQHSVLEKLIAPFYSGPLGIDMFRTNDGRINPCVEINLRMTMGHVTIALYESLGRHGLFKPWVPEFIPDI